MKKSSNIFAHNGTKKNSIQNNFDSKKLMFDINIILVKLSAEVDHMVAVGMVVVDMVEVDMAAVDKVVVDSLVKYKISFCSLVSKFDEKNNYFVQIEAVVEALEQIEALKL